jgi:hypothetical protein
MLSAMRMAQMVRSGVVTRIPAALLVLFAHVSAAAAQAPPAPPSAAAETWYTERLITGSSTPGVEHLWSKGPWLRSELVIAGQPIVQIVRGDRYVIVNRLLREGVSIQRNPSAIQKDASRRRPIGDDPQIILAAGGEPAGNGEVGGQPCKLVRLTDADGRRETCVSTSEAHVPLRTTFWHRASNRSTEINYLTWASQVPLGDDFFAPDPGVRLEELGYEQYLAAVAKGPVGPAPPTFSHLLHGR